MIGLIYKVVPKEAPFDVVYIGSTTESLNDRWTKHKIHCQKWIDKKVDMKCSIYPYMKERGINKFKIEIVKTYEISDINHLTAYEQLWINKTKCVNIVNPLHGYSCKFFRKYTGMEYREDKGEELLIKKREYHKNNKEQINQSKRGDKGKELYNQHKDRVNAWKSKNEERVKTVKAAIYQKNKANIKAKQKESYEKKKNIRTCLCGSTYDYAIKGTRDTHYNTLKHRQHVELIHEHLRTNYNRL
jgi:hypothetical protein